jgi:hypothetical protein
MAIDPNIALGVRPIEIANPLAQYGQVAQIQAAQNQNQVSQMQIDQMRRDEETMRQIQAKAVAHGGPSDLNQIADAYINSGNHKFIEFGVGLRQKLDEKAQFAKIMALGGPIGAPEPTTAPAAAPPATAAPTVAYPQTATPTNALGSGTFGMTPTAAPVNALAPAVAPAVPATPVNALTAPPAGPDVTLLRRKRDMFLSMGTAQGNAAAKTMDAEIALASKEPVYHNVTGVGLVDPRTGRVVMPEGVKDSEFEKLLARSNLSDVQKNALRIQRAQKEATHAPGTTVRIDQKQESAFESGLGTGQAKRIIDSQVAAKDAASIIDTVKTGRDLMKSGMITGAGADFLVNFNQGLKTVGIDAGLADAAANSQAFAANMAGNVGKLIKQFGSGTALSDADREFAKDMAGGRISLDAKAINRILDINERAARSVITQHNKDVKGIKTNIPLEVEMPPEVKAPVAGVPSSAVAYLRANPSMKGAFDAKYGAGAADRALKGQ